MSDLNDHNLVITEKKPVYTKDTTYINYFRFDISSFVYYVAINTMEANTFLIRYLHVELYLQDLSGSYTILWKLSIIYVSGILGVNGFFFSYYEIVVI
jgi:hypothetical protein